MTTQQYHNPADYARSVIRSAFNANGRQNKNSMKSLNRALSLAQKRGYTNTEVLLESIKNASTDSPKLDRMMRGLFEYVSEEEFSQLARMDDSSL